MATKQTGSAVFGEFKPSMTAQFLPRCWRCEAPHPKAIGAIDTSRCHECGTPSIEGPAYEVDAEFTMTGIGGWIAAKCLAAGRWLRAKAERI